MRIALHGLFLALFVGACGRSPEPAADFAGDWESPPFSVLFERGISEQVEALRDGSHPNLSDFDEEALNELLALPPEEAKRVLMVNGALAPETLLPDQTDPIFGVTLAPPDRFGTYMIVDGKRYGQTLEAEYEQTSQEIVCRHEGGPTVFTIDGDQLITANGHSLFPRSLTLRRVAEDPTAPNPTP